MCSTNADSSVSSKVKNVCCMHSIPLLNYPENRRLKKKCLGHKMCAMFSSKTFVFTHFVLLKYLASCAADAHNNAYKFSCKVSAVFNNFEQNCTC